MMCCDLFVLLFVVGSCLLFRALLFWSFAWLVLVVLVNFTVDCDFLRLFLLLDLLSG